MVDPGPQSGRVPDYLHFSRLFHFSPVQSLPGGRIAPHPPAQLVVAEPRTGENQPDHTGIDHYRPGAGRRKLQPRRPVQIQGGDLDDTSPGPGVPARRTHVLRTPGQGPAHLQRGEVRVLRQNQRGHSGDVRCGHGGTGTDPVPRAGSQAEDPVPRGRQVDAEIPVGERKDFTLLIRRGHGDGLIQTRRHKDLVVPFIAGRGHQNATGLSRVPDRIPDEGRKLRGPPAQVEDVGLVVDSVDHGGGNVVVLQISSGGQIETRSESHQAHPGSHPGNAPAIVRHRGDDPGHMGAVIGLVPRIVVPLQVIPFPRQSGSIGEIPADQIIDVPIGIVVHTGLTRHFGRVVPQLSGDVRVVELQP